MAEDNKKDDEANDLDPTFHDEDIDFDDLEDWDIDEDHAEETKQETKPPAGEATRQVDPSKVPPIGTKPTPLQPMGQQQKPPAVQGVLPPTPGTEVAQQATPQPVSPPIEEPLVAIQNVPMALNVELGQIEMSLEKILALEPGNILELDFHPEEGVQLVINGRVVGRGEIIKIGESLGVRVLELGH